MLEPLVIALVVMVLAADSGGIEPLMADAPWWASVAAGVGLPIAVATLAHVRLGWLARKLDRTGRVRWVRSADRTMVGVSALLGLAFGLAVFVFGWLGMVRGWIGDLVLIDEGAAMAPSLLALVSVWASQAPIERRVREAAIIRSLDTGAQLHPPPTTAQHVIDRVRHRLLLVLIPIGMILGWTEAVYLAANRLYEAGRFSDDTLSAMAALAQLAGVLATLALTPPIMRRVWSTVALDDGPLRTRLVDLCRAHAVRVRDILVWRTHGTMLNGAVMGIVGPLRYVLLTDALLERLPDAQLEAVMAHEVGHVRRRHMIWLMLTLLATVGMVSWGFAAITDALRDAATGAGAPVWTHSAWALDAPVLGALGLAGLWVFGVVSRRFERQADAFAVQHLSGLTRRTRGAGMHAQPEAIEAMAGALDAVARLNHIPPRKFMFRHGSIDERRRALLRLRGAPLDRFPIDRLVRRTKLATLAAIALLVVFAALDAQRVDQDQPGAPAQPKSTLALR